MPAPCPTDWTGPGRCWRSARWLRSAPCSRSPSGSVRLVHATPRQAPCVKHLPARIQHQRRRRSRLPPRFATELSSVVMRWQRRRAPERLWSGRSSGVSRKRGWIESEESTCSTKDKEDIRQNADKRTKSTTKKARGRAWRGRTRPVAGPPDVSTFRDGSGFFSRALAPPVHPCGPRGRASRQRSHNACAVADSRAARAIWRRHAGLTCLAPPGATRPPHPLT